MSAKDSQRTVASGCRTAAIAAVVGSSSTAVTCAVAGREVQEVSRPAARLQDLSRR